MDDLAGAADGPYVSRTIGPHVPHALGVGHVDTWDGDLRPAEAALARLRPVHHPIAAAAVTTGRNVAGHVERAALGARERRRFVVAQVGAVLQTTEIRAVALLAAVPQAIAALVQADAGEAI